MQIQYTTNFNTDLAEEVYYSGTQSFIRLAPNDKSSSTQHF